MITQLLIVFFFTLILNSIINYFTKPTIIEGATSVQYQQYDNDPLILANKNAANIDVLKQKIDEISNIVTEVSKNTADIKNVSQTVNSLMQSMSPTDNKASQQNQKMVDEDPSTFNMPTTN